MKPIPNTEGYFADEDGNIYSIRPVKRSKKWRETPYKMKPQITPNGYHIVKIIFKGKRQMMLVSYLILLTFVGDRPSELHQVCHGVNGKNDNSLANLSYGTRFKNQGEDRERDGTLPFGESHKRSKLTNKNIIEIRSLYKQGFLQKDIAKIFNVSHSNISVILKGKTWVRVV